MPMLNSVLPPERMPTPSGRDAGCAPSETEPFYRTTTRCLLVLSSYINCTPQVRSQGACGCAPRTNSDAPSGTISHFRTSTAPRPARADRSLCVQIVAAMQGHYRQQLIYIVLHLSRSTSAHPKHGRAQCCSGRRSSLAVESSPSLTLALLQANQHGVQLAAVVWHVPVITAEVRDLGVCKGAAMERAQLWHGAHT
jgi:hypothetical protein